MMNSKMWIRRSWGRLAALSLVCLLLTGSVACSITRMANYDQVMDQGVTQLATKTQRFISGLETAWLKAEAARTPQERDKLREGASYEANAAFYADFRSDLHVLELRAMATPNDDITQKQLKALGELLDEVEKQNKEGFQNAEEFAFLQRGFDTAFGAILKLEVAKKRGKA